MRFLVDENLPIDVVEALQAAGHHVDYVAGTHLKGASDQDIWRHAAEHQLVLVTRDLDFPLRETPTPPGLVLIRAPESFRRQQLGTLMSEFVTSADFDRIEGRITVVLPGRSRSRNL